MQDQNAIYIELSIHPENGSVYVDSKHVPGLHLMGKSFQSMKPTLEMAIKMLFRDNRRMEVNVIWLKEMGTEAVCNVLEHFERIAVVPVGSNSAAA